MKQSRQRRLAGILVALLVASNFPVLNTRADVGGSTGGSGGLEGVLSDVFNIVVPTQPTLSVSPDKIYTNEPLDFILDPKGIAGTGNLIGKTLEPGATVYFQNIESGALYDYSSTSDGFTVINKGMMDVDVMLDASLSGMDGVRLTNNKTFSNDKSASAYFALKDSDDNAVALDKFGAVIKKTLKGQPDAYKVIYNSSSDQYKYELKSDDILLANNIKFVDYTFRIMGACNSSNAWTNLSNIIQPVITVTWHVSARSKNMTPSIPKTSYVMYKGSPVLVGVDLGEGTLRATGIRSITFKSRTGEVQTLLNDKYALVDGVLTFKTTLIDTMFSNGIASREFTVNFNDTKKTSIKVTVIADDVEPSNEDVEYTMSKDEAVKVDVDLGLGLSGATGIKSITFVNLTGGTQTLLTDKYTFANGILTFKAAYINMMLENGISSREHIVTLNDKAGTKMMVTLTADGQKPSIETKAYTMERGKPVDLSVDLGSGTLGATGIKSITFVNLTGGTQTLLTDKYAFINDKLTFKSTFIDMMFGNGVTSRIFTVNFNDIAQTSIKVTLSAVDKEPTNQDSEHNIYKDQAVNVDIDLGSGASGATGIKSITFVNPLGETKTLLTDKYVFANGTLTFKAAYINMLFQNGIISRKHIITLNNVAGTQIAVTLSANGEKPIIGQKEYIMERGKAVDVNVSLGTDSLGATGIKTITFMNLTGKTQTLLTDKYTFANGVLTFKSTLIDTMLSNGVTSRVFTITFNDVASTKATITLMVPSTAPSLETGEYVMASGSSVKIVVDLGAGSLGATGIKSITYKEGAVVKTVPSTYYILEGGILEIKATYINGVLNGGIVSRDYEITFNDKAETKGVITLKK